MPTDLRNLPAFLASTAVFRTWAQGLHDQLIACGMVQTADTGQVDLSAANLPAANSYVGYRIYRFNDDLHNTGNKKVFLKLEYGVGSGNDQPAFRAQWATATNGAGVLSGSIAPSGAQVCAAGSGKIAGQVLPSYCCGDGGSLRLCSNLDLSSNSYRIYMFAERSRDSDGEANGIGVQLYMGGGSQIVTALPSTGSVPGGSGSVAALPILPFTTGGMVSTAGAEVALYPGFLVWGRPYPLLGLLGYELASIGELVQLVSADWLGAPRALMPLGDGGPPGPNGNMGIAMLWE